MRARLVVVASALALVACGGEEGKRPEPEPLCRPLLPLSDQPDPGSGPVDCNALDGLELYLIDSFEPGVARTGWYINNDRSALSDPLPDTDPVPATAIPGGRCVGAVPTAAAATVCDRPDVPRGQCTEPYRAESQFALHIRTGNLTRDGGVFGRNLSKTCSPVNETPICTLRPGPPEIGACSTGMGPSPPRHGCRAAEDTSDWDGIVLWGRKGPGSQSTVRVRVSDAETDEAGCICNPYTNQNDTSDGCDKFGKHVTLDGNFRAYLVPFDEMQQGGWGRPASGIDRSNLFSVAIEYGRGAWDLWIDEIAFYRRREP